MNVARKSLLVSLCEPLHKICYAGGNLLAGRGREDWRNCQPFPEHVHCPLLTLPCFVFLEPGVNIITGESKTGTSALIPIVDYCLGSADYEVPVGVIREFTRWYAIRLQTAEGQLFLARKEPGQRTTSNEMHLIIGPEVSIPAATALTGNTDRDAVVKELSRRLGMMEQALAESPFDQAYTEPPTIRNVAPFLFQPQNVIANKDTLFYKTDPERHQQHRQRLQRIFPFVLGAINAEYFQLKNDLDNALRELRKWERQLSEYRALAGDGISVARALWDRAVALGLINIQEPPPHDGSGGKSTGTLDLAELHARLAELVNLANAQLSRASLITGNPERAALLEAQSRTLRTEIAALRQRLTGAEELSQEASLFTGTLRLQSGRLRAITVLKDTVEETHTCPLSETSPG